MPRTVRHALGMVPRAASNDALPSLLRRQVGHLVVSAAQLEAEDGEEVFTLEEHTAFEAIGEVDGRGEGGFCHDIVDPGGEDEAQVVGVAVGEEEGGWDRGEGGGAAGEFSGWGWVRGVFGEGEA